MRRWREAPKKPSSSFSLLVPRDKKQKPPPLLRSATRAAEEAEEVYDSGVKYRPMELKDCAPCFHMGNSLFTATLSMSLYRSWDQFQVVGCYSGDPEYCVVAERDGKLLGFVLGSLITKKKKYGYINWVAVDRQYQRQGIGSRLAHRVERGMIQQGAEMLLVDTPAENYAAICFFRKMKYSDPINQVYMSLEIGPKPAPTTSNVSSSLDANAPGSATFVTSGNSNTATAASAAPSNGNATATTTVVGGAVSSAPVVVSNGVAALSANAGVAPVSNTVNSTHGDHSTNGELLIPALDLQTIGGDGAHGIVARHAAENGGGGGNIGTGLATDAMNGGSVAIAESALTALVEGAAGLKRKRTSQTTTEPLTVPAQQQPTVIVREMEVDDVYRVFQIGDSVFTETRPNLYRFWDESEVIDLFETDSDFCLVAEVEGQIQGFALGTTLEKKGTSTKYGYLIWLAVSPDAQRLSIGRRLYECFLKLMLNEGVTMMIVDTQADNAPALNFFAKLGFEITEKYLYYSKDIRKIRRSMSPHDYSEGSPSPHASPSLSSSGSLKNSQ